MTNQLSQMQQILLDTYKAFKEFCDSNDIKFFAAYGTMLGVVRHKGFIPWDDDMDVFMRRPDYDKFISIRDKLKGTNYGLSYYRDIGHPFNFAKFFDNTKTVLCFPQFPLVIGPYIDVFCLDGTFDDYDEFVKFFNNQGKAFWDLRKCHASHPWKEILADIKSAMLFEGLIKIIKKVYYVPQYKRFLKKVDRIEQTKAQMQECSYYSVYNFKKEHRFNKDWFNGSVELPFEDTTIYLPHDYDACLKLNYGDYMTPPPVQARTGHDLYYVNLQKRMTYEEIMAEKPLQRLGRRDLKLSTILNELKLRKGE